MDTIIMLNGDLVAAKILQVMETETLVELDGCVQQTVQNEQVDDHDLRSFITSHPLVSS